MPRAPTKGAFGDKELKIIEMAMQGRTQTDIAKELKMGQASVSRFLNRQDVIALVRAQSTRKLETIKEKLSAGEAKGIQKVLELLDSDNGWIVIQAARFIAERADAARAHDSTMIVVNFANMKAPMLPDVLEESDAGKAVPTSGSVN